MNALVIELDENLRPLHPMRSHLVRDGKVLAELTTAREFEQLLKTLNDPPLSRWPAAPQIVKPVPLIKFDGQGRIGQVHETQSTAAMRTALIALIVVVVIVAGLWFWSIRSVLG